MSKILTKDFKFKLDAIDEEKGTFSGYASVFGVIDSYNDVVDKGAFRKTIREKGAFPILDHHNVTAPIGVIKPTEDDKGLRVVGELNMDVQRARELRSLAKQGALSGLSIGYEVVKDKRDEKTGTRFLKEIKLWEVSLVTFPACPGAGVTDMKDSPLVESLAAVHANILGLTAADIGDAEAPEIKKTIESLNALLTREPSGVDTPKGDEPPSDSGVDAETIEAMKSLVETTRGLSHK